MVAIGIPKYVNILRPATACIKMTAILPTTLLDVKESFSMQDLVDA
jgi:hypothetical protein